MPKTENSHDFGGFIDFVKQDVRMDDHPFTGAVFTFPTDVGKHGKVRGGINQTEQNPFGRVRVAGE